MERSMVGEIAVAGACGMTSTEMLMRGGGDVDAAPWTMVRVMADEGVKERLWQKKQYW